MQYITPAIIMIIIICAITRKRTVYNDFIEGAETGMRLVADIFPPLVAMLVAAAMLKASGALEIFLGVVTPVTERLGIPAEVMPLAVIRPISGSGAIGVLSGILNEYGADSFIGRLASVICGGTETTFYCLAVYFAKTRVTSVKRAIPSAVIGDLACIAAAVAVVGVM